MSEHGPDLLRLRALMRRLAAPVTAFAERAEAASERITRTSGLPLVGVDPFGEIAHALNRSSMEPRLADRQDVNRTPGQRVAHPAATPRGPMAARTSSPSSGRKDPLRVSGHGGPVPPSGTPPLVESLGRIASALAAPFAGRKEPLGAPGKGIAPRAGSEPRVFRLGGARIADAPAVESQARSASRERSSPARNQERAEAPWPAEPPRGQAAASAAGATGSTTPLDRVPRSESPTASPGEAVGLGLVGDLLARIAGSPSARGSRGISHGTRQSLEGPPPTWDRERTTPPRAAAPPRGGDVAAAVAPMFPTARDTERTATEAAPLGELAADPVFADSAPDDALRRSPPSLQAPAPALDPDLLADLVNDALVAQAGRFGVDLS